MKRTILYLLVLVMLYALSGCVFENTVANPQVPTQPTAQSTPMETEESSEPEWVWADDPILALVDPPPAKSIVYDVFGEDAIPHSTYLDNNYTATAWFSGTDYESVKQYAQALEQSGFNLYVIWDDAPEREAFVFFGMNQSCEYVAINYNYLDGDPADYETGILNTYDGYITVATPWANQPKPPADLQSGREPWGHNEYQAQLPEPDPTYSSAQIVYDPGTGEESHYFIFFEYSDYFDVLGYTQALQDFGYNIHTSETTMPYSCSYRFIAENDAGYMVELNVYPPSDNAEYSVFCSLYKPERQDTYWRGWNVDGLPEPAASDWKVWNTDVSAIAAMNWTIQLEGMDFNTVRTYIQQLREFGYTDNVKLSSDAEKGQLYFEAEAERIYEDEVAPNGTYSRYFRVKLTYDDSPEAVAENGTACVIRLERIDDEIIDRWLQ